MKSYFPYFITAITLLLVENEKMKVTNNKSGLCLVAYCHGFFNLGPIIHILSVDMVFHVILYKVMQVLQGLWGWQEVKQRTLRFLMEGFWA